MYVYVYVRASVCVCVSDEGIRKVLTFTYLVSGVQDVVAGVVDHSGPQASVLERSPIPKVVIRCAVRCAQSKEIQFLSDSLRSVL